MQRDYTQDRRIFRMTQNRQAEEKPLTERAYISGSELSNQMKVSLSKSKSIDLLL